MLSEDRGSQTVPQKVAIAYSFSKVAASDKERTRANDDQTWWIGQKKRTGIESGVGQQTE